MFEPVYMPEMKRFPVSLGEVRFGINYSRDFPPSDRGADPLHIHPYLEIYFHISGKASFFVGGNLYEVCPGEAVVSRANEVHVCFLEDTSHAEHFCLWIDAGEDSPLLGFLREIPGPLISFQNAQTELSELLRQLCSFSGAEDRGLEKGALFLQILVLLTKCSHGSGEFVGIPEALRKIMDDMNENFSRIHYIRELSERHFVSLATLNRWFRTYVHVSPREYLESRKLAQAVRLLEGGASVTEACMGAGFSDCSHFILLFKRKFGKTPLQYKRSYL